MKINIEVPFVCATFAYSLCDLVTVNWLMYRACYVVMEYNQTECALLGTTYANNVTSKIEEKVQPYVAIISMTKMLIEALATAVICLFVGPWSDKYGRKPVLLLSFAGGVVNYLVLAVITVTPNLSPWYVLISTIPICFTGGFLIIFAVMLCYITDITTSSERSIRIAIFYAVLVGASFCGSLLSPYAWALLGYYILYLCCAALAFLAWLTTYLLVPESVENVITENKYRNLFKTSHITDTMQTAFKKREKSGRILLFTFTTVLVLFLLNSADNIWFLYLREKFHWSLQKVSVLNAFNTLISVLGGVIGIYVLNKILGVKESLLIFIAGAFLAVASFVRAFATQDWQVYASTAFYCFEGIISPLIRSSVSKMVSNDEVGKVFSFIAICETIIGPLGSPLYTFIYNNTIVTFPGAYLIVKGGVYFAVSAIGLTVSIIQRQYTGHSHMIET